jgi:hypothetical protein
MLFSDGATGATAKEPWVFVGAGGIVPLDGHPHTEIVLNGTEHW